MDHILAIYDSEKKYVKKLAAYFERQNKMPFQIMAFDNMTKLIRFFGDKPASVLLIDEESWELSLKELAEQTILLTDRKERELLDSFMNDCSAIPASFNRNLSDGPSRKYIKSIKSVLYSLSNQTEKPENTSKLRYNVFFTADSDDCG